jgi:Starch-binding associating with outer membrane
MKRLKYIIILCLPALLVATGCNKFKDFGNTNVDPSVTSSPILGALMTNVQAGLSGYSAQVGLGYYCQYFSETQYPATSLYAIPQNNYSGEYAGSLYDLQNIITNPKTTNNMIALSRILKAYIFWTVTDRWGDVPYTEALTGEATPKLDAQEVIYKGIISELTQAVAQFDNSVISGDIIGGANIAKWKKAANSWRMLMALRLSKRFPDASGYAATEFKAALNDAAGSIAVNADNLLVAFPGNFKSNWYGLYDGRKDVGESATMTALMGSFADGRQVAFGGATEDQSTTNPNWNVTSAVGVPYGHERGYVDSWTQSNPTWARVLRGDLRTPTGKVTIITAAEVLIARAEAADRGWTSENAATLLQNGVNASFEQWGVAAPAASYFTQANVAFTAPTGTGANLKQIALQRFIASYPDGLQGWSEWRRTGYPVLTPAPDALNTSKQIVRRYTYGQSEYATNKVEVEAKAAAMPGGDTQDSKVWWDQ